MTTAQADIALLSFDKVFYFPEYLQKLVEGREAFPVHMQLGPVNFCNHDCTFCYAARSMFDGMNVQRERIEVERLMEVAEEMCQLGLRSVTIVGSGEPTLHPRIDEIITGLARCGLDVGMYTNGSCVTDKMLRAIVENMTFVRFSLTGASREVHDLVHANGDYERVIRNIERIADARTGKLPTLGSQFILASYSAKDAVDGARLARSIGLDYYEIKPAYVAPGKPNQRENTLSIDEAHDLMMQAKALETDDFKVFAKMGQMEGVFTKLDDRPYDDCPGQNTNAVLESDFGLYICSNHKTADFRFGDVREKSFKEVWQGERRREILANLNVHHCEPHCRMDPLNKTVHRVRTGEQLVPLNLPPPTPQMHPNFL